MSELCSTKYPVLLVHGIGFRDCKYYNYWGRIPSAVIKEGGNVYYGYQDSWGKIESNAYVLRDSLLSALEKSGAEKVNIIAHSKGGLDARYMISSLGMQDKVASLTTISTPHYGSEAMESLMRLPDFMFNFIGMFVNLYFRLLGDNYPDFKNVCMQISKSGCKIFNNENPNAEGVYYQSYAALMKNSFSDVLMLLPHMIIKLFDGKNDGIVSVKSSEWGDFQGIIKPVGRRGISHADIVDFRRHNCMDFDQRGFYTDIIKNLKTRGF